MKRSISILILLIELVFAVDAKQKAAAGNDDTFITVRFDRDQYYENEYGTLYFTLHTTDPAFRFDSRPVLPQLDKGKFSYLQKLKTVPGEWSKETINGKEYTVVDLESYVFSIAKKGKYGLTGGKYRLIRQESGYYIDPIWGRRRMFEDVTYEIPIEKSSVRISGLPAAEPSIGFSGAIGDYEIKTHVLSKEIVVNEPCHIRISVTGPGMIEEGIMPDYSKAFRENIKLKSISDHTQYVYKNNKVYTQLDLDCEIVPTSRNATIGEIYLGFFDPDKKAYRKAISAPVSLDVQSSLIRMETTDI